MPTISDVLRTEKKYPLDYLDARKLCGKLNRILQPDPHCAGTDGYLVRSLYFDSYDNEDYFDKAAGLENRKKIRLRIYSPDDAFAKLEWKQKQGAAQRKRSMTVSRDHAQRMAQGSYSCLLEYDDPLAKQFYSVMRSRAYLPRSIVEYRRYAFALAANDTRITLDSGLRACEGNADLFSKELPFYYPAASPNRVTLEVKYNHFLLSYVKEVLSPYITAETASSKYCASRRYSLGGITL